MTGRQLARWQAFERIYDLPDGYYVAGKVCALLSACHGGDQTSRYDHVPYYAAMRDAANGPSAVDDDERTARENQSRLAALKSARDRVRAQQGEGDA